MAVGLFDLELQLLDLRSVFTHQVHAGAVSAVLRAGGEQFGQHLRGVAVSQTLDGPHLRFVERVARGVRMVWKVRTPVREGG